MPAATPASSSAARITPGPSSWTAAIWACRSSKAWRLPRLRVRQPGEGRPGTDGLPGRRALVHRQSVRPVPGGRGRGRGRHLPGDAALELEGVLREPARHDACPRDA
ncbi:hypothetical protein G6F24_017055 [Rhizopus arrhizus]|nr:hypothetical protein G6F24_017055 [Rhizopus arrhizus]